MSIENEVEKQMDDTSKREGYSHGVISCGFWPGNEQFNVAAFYVYITPSPPGLEAASFRPSTGFYSPELSEFLLRYEDVQQASLPEQLLLDLFHSTYEAGATLAQWDREALERHPAVHKGDRL